MTTAPTNEMQPIDELRLLVNEFDLNNPDWGFRKGVILEAIDRLSATTSARDVREALEATNKLLIDVMHGPSPAIKERASCQFDQNIAALSNLDAAAPAAGGDETIGFAAWHPVHGFGAINELAIRELFSHAKTDANLANHPSDDPRWQVVPVSVVKGNLT